MTKERMRKRKQQRKITANNKESRDVKRDLLAMEQRVVDALNKPQAFNAMLSNDALISCGNKEQIINQAKLLDADIRRLAGRLDVVRTKINGMTSFVSVKEQQEALMIGVELQDILSDFAQTADTTAFALGGLLDDAHKAYSLKQQETGETNE